MLRFNGRPVVTVEQRQRAVSLPPFLAAMLRQEKPKSRPGGQNVKAAEERWFDELLENDNNKGDK